MMKRTFCDFMGSYFLQGPKKQELQMREVREFCFSVSSVCVDDDDDARSSQISLYHRTLCVCCWISMYSSSPQKNKKKSTIAQCLI